MLPIKIVSGNILPQISNMRKCLYVANDSYTVVLGASTSTFRNGKVTLKHVYGFSFSKYKHDRQNSLQPNDVQVL